jgi:non-specific serine/threonine protein kinase
MNFISDYLRRNVQSVIRNRGAWLYNYGDYVRLDSLDRKACSARYIVKSESGRGAYTVSVMNFDKSSIKTACTCPYDGGTCKHSVAALMHLEAHLRVNPREFNSQDEAFPLQVFDIPFFIANAQTSRLEEGIKFLRLNKIVQKKIGDGEVYFDVKDIPNREVSFKAISNMLYTSCDCGDNGSALCSHKVGALAKLVKTYGENPFASLRDFTKEKELGLAEYGYSLEDKRIDELFEFELKNGQMIVTPKDLSIVKLNEFQNWKSISSKVVKPTEQLSSELVSKEEGAPVIIYVFDFNKGSVTPNNSNPRFFSVNSMLNRQAFSELTEILSPDTKEMHHFPGFEICPVRATIKNGKLAGRLNVLDPEENNFKLKDIDAFESADSTLIRTAIALDVHNISETLAPMLSPGAMTSFSMTWEDLSKSKDFEAAVDYIGTRISETVRLLKNKRTYEYTGDKFDNIKLKTIKEIVFWQKPAMLEFDLDEQGDNYVLRSYIVVGEERLPLGYLKRLNYWMLRESDRIFWLDKKSAKTLYILENRDTIVVKKNQIEGFLNEFVLPIMNAHNVSFNIPVQLNDVEGIFNAKLYLRENEDSLLFSPVFAYEYQGNTREIEFDNRTRQVVTEAEDGEMFMMYRDEDKENKVREFFAALHPSFLEQSESNQATFSLSVSQLFENEWFFGAFEKVQQQDIEVLGFNQLTKIKYNPNRAKINVRASSGIDWFDLEIVIEFGEQTVNLKDVRKAVLNNQHYVRLGDGTLGMLPQEWLEKYASILKIGKLDGDTIRMSDRQFSLVEEMYEEIDNHEVLRNLYDKKQRLRQFENIKDVALPENIQANLRDYQKAGFNWLNFLEDFGWGGILADDMGLGKTLQAITFIQHIVNQNPNSTNLVAVPKSLVFNWIKEIEKFAPNLNALAYYGPLRHQYKNELEKYQVIIATYGSVRSDITELREINFNYVILDESQAVKNPDALVSKAVKLLKAKNRICMTGTPIENNTFDLYSQIDFLNPGMLGSVDYFKKDYANPIDRDKDENAVHRLRKLVYPFILRRTKEEVAKELPEKVETVIYCEMGAHQRKVYDAFKDRYRDFIMGKIDDEGLGNAGMYILEGLMKLRQICNSPALLNEKDDFGKESVKLEELIPRIAEDSGRHKILVFSQFLGMLDLIKKELDKLHIKYEYLDGQTKDRMDRVDNFQNNEDCRVFLMSLKAGGVGLNLTAADYVYLIDPWWNPAVEAQAIDRAHRIGQERSVFAYKMICKDTIEEKILQLQERKKAVAKDLINVESGFIKALDRDDVRDLFS